MSGGRCPDPEAVERAADAAQLGWSRVDAAVARLRIERSSPGAEVRVVVDGRGELVDVGFTGRVRTTAPERLAALLLDVLARARADVPAAVADALGRAGVAGAAADAVLEGYRRRFPPPPGGAPERDARAGERTWLR